MRRRHSSDEDAALKAPELAVAEHSDVQTANLPEQTALHGAAAKWLYQCGLISCGFRRSGLFQGSERQNFRLRFLRVWLEA